MTRRATTLKVWAALLAAMVAAIVAALAAGSGPAKAAFPGDNGAIAFEYDATPGDLQPSGVIYRMNSDGFGPTQLSNTTGGNTSPDWSSDGKKIAFTNNGANMEVYWMDSDGSDASEKNLTNNPAFDGGAAFFPDPSVPDRNTIAFTSNRSGNYDIYTMTVNDSGTIINGPTQLTTSTAFDSGAAVSPDGKKIAFSSNRGGNTDIYVMKANVPESPTNIPVKLTKSASFDALPDWSPDGTKIAFISQRSVDMEVWVMKPRPEGRKNRPKNLTNNPAYDGSPVFSPSGRKIAFISYRSGEESDIFKMKADGSAPVNLTNSDTVPEFSPSWQPDP